MSFSLALTPAHHDLIERTHAFARDAIRPVAGHYDGAEEFPWPVLEKAAREGFYNPLFYRDLIGDPTGLSLPLFMEKLFWGCAGIGLAIVMPALALSAMAQAATPEQLLRWAPECFGAPGDLKLAALAVSEPEGGSDVRNLRTHARRDGEDWILDGHKMWIGNGGIADVHVVNATVDPELGHRGQALFVVPGGTPGLRLVRKLSKLGCRASHTAELRFEGCRVPGENLLGGPERLERRLAAARARAPATAGRRRSARSSRPGRWSPRRRSGSPARRSSSPATTRAAARRDPRQAGCLVPARGARHEPRRGAAAHLAGGMDGGAAGALPHAEGSMAKLKASETAVRITEHAIQVCGGWGYIRDLPVEKWYRDAKLYTIFEGTSEIQRLVIGRTLGDAATTAPLHHRSPVSGPVLGRAVGRGTKRRSVAAGRAMRVAARTPPALMRLPMRILAPPPRAPRRTS